MAYSNAIPQPTDQLKNSQDDLLQNFIEIKNLIDVNHETFADANEGKHKFIQFPEQVAAPATAVNEAGLYSIEGVYSTVAELAFRRENSGLSSVFTEVLGAINGWTRFPSGLLIKWGTDTVSAANAALATHTVTFPVLATIPAFTALYAVFPLAEVSTPATDIDVAIYLSTNTNLNFVVRQWERSDTDVQGTSVGAYRIQWLAIGVGN